MLLAKVGGLDEARQMRALPEQLGSSISEAAAAQVTAQGIMLCTAVPPALPLTPSPMLEPLQALKARWHLPYGAVVHPLAELAGPVAVANPSGGPIIRCKRCRTYMNPFMQWMDGGR